MTNRSRQRRLGGLALALALATAVVGARVAPAGATFDEGAGDRRHVVAGGWSGQVDPATGVPLSAGLSGVEETIQVIPYLSHGITTETAQAQQAAKPFVQGVTDFPRQVAAPRSEPVSGGSTVEWNDGLTLGIGALVLGLALGLGLGYLRRPRIAGL